MTILVTGGAGYIGSHTVRQLIKNNQEVIVLDNLSTGHRESINYCPLIVGDINDTTLVTEVIRNHKVQSVIHFAANSLVGESQENPEKYYLNNVVGTLNLLKSMRECKVNNIVFSSSAAVYGEPQEVPIKETAPTNPVNVYGRTKLMIEQILVDYRRAYGINYASLRYFNACGANQKGDIGEDHDPETHLIPIIMQVALDQREKLIIYGKDYDTPDGTCIRDFIHVDDLAFAHSHALEYLEYGGSSDAFNLGYGKGYSVLEIVQAIEKITKRIIKHEIGPRRVGDPPSLTADPTRAKEILRWQPRYNRLEDIIETAWKWHGKKNVSHIVTQERGT